MKMRHVRAIAIFGIAVVALTGARGSHGGSCGGSSSSSSSSSGSGHSDNDSTSGGTGGSVPGGSSADKASRDVTIGECKYDSATKNLVARITIKNDGVMDYDYNVTMKFTGVSASPVTSTKTAIAVASGASESVELTAVYPGSGDGSEYNKCEVSRASRS
ncbi:hypothetical protein [Streptomyces exfoliatus]|uniref:hypothetical protein n=1 Tax=Streptomyces exfoliatus TaxID=1905 RepID=UPI000465549D|nr:hypothetical protein [Streptomyces exfoliatus]